LCSGGCGHLPIAGFAADSARHLASGAHLIHACFIRDFPIVPSLIVERCLFPRVVVQGAPSFTVMAHARAILGAGGSMPGKSWPAFCRLWRLLEVEDDFCVLLLLLFRLDVIAADIVLVLPCCAVVAAVFGLGDFSAPHRSLSLGFDLSAGPSGPFAAYCSFDGASGSGGAEATVSGAPAVALNMSM
jgi:hypothetical protein